MATLTLQRLHDIDLYLKINQIPETVREETKMKIAVPIAAYEEGTTGEYVARSIRRLGHVADILSQWDFYRAFENKEYDFYFCVDSGGPLNLFVDAIMTQDLRRVCFWMIDYRRGKDLKDPNDLRTCQLLQQMNGWIFQSQFEDFEDCLQNNITNCSWLPLAADQDVWSNEPVEAGDFSVGFAGNVWDGTRQRVLDAIRNRFGHRFGFFGHGSARMEEGAHLLRRAKIGFNISSFYSEPIAYDVNMRVFETLMTGTPLVTNYVPSLNKLGLMDVPFVRVYRQEREIIPLIESCLHDEQFLISGPSAREWALRSATYDLRIKMAFETLASHILGEV